MNHHGNEVSIEALVPTRADRFRDGPGQPTRGLGVMSHLFHEYGPDRGETPPARMVRSSAWESGEAMAYALNMVQERGRLMVEPGDQIYIGMIVGENARETTFLSTLQSQTSDQYAFIRRWQRHPAFRPVQDVAGARLGIHRVGRIRRKPRRKICACGKSFWMRTNGSGRHRAER